YPHLTRSYNLHPSLFFVSESDVRESAPKQTLDFLDRLAERPGRAPILEVPMVPLFPLQPLYQMIHRREIVVATLPSGFGQRVFGAEGMRLTHVVPIGAVDSSDAFEYIVVHKAIKEEISYWYHHLSRREPAAAQIRGMSSLVDRAGLDLQFDDDYLATLPRFGPIVYEDAFLRVHAPQQR
ncbi:MAG: hypothetical protein V3T33_00700, partial [Myxococcota bacterium]